MTAFVAQSMVARVVTVENVKYDIDESGKTAVLTNGRNVNRDYFSIPSSIWYGNITYEVTGIGDEAFSNNKKIKEVAVPKSVTTIGDYTFKNCTQLRNITLVNHLKNLGEGAFYGCSRLNKVQIQDRYRSSYINIKKIHLLWM
ncbi:MAG: leucine-rich repeat domain-containing protein [Paludibacteraceae bacterium]|nr:leucine-rich repeat domain-containing protein [Paludibacteraceae bacterium]